MSDMNSGNNDRPLLPTDSKMRKETPIFTGFLRYFPRAAAYAARISVLGNEKHNPGEPLHWAEGKSMDHPDCIVRHLIEAETFDTDDGALHAGKLFWRAGANLEIILREREKAGLPIWDEEVIAENRRKQAEKLAAKLTEMARVPMVSDEPYDPSIKPEPQGLTGTTGCSCDFARPGPEPRTMFTEYDPECIPGN
jgi:hypothetical protein